MKLTIVVTVLGQHEMATLAIRKMVENCSDPITNIVVVDNGGDYEFPDESPRVVVERRLGADGKAINQGVYPVFKYAMDILPTVDGDVVMFFHSDMMINERGFDFRILAEFIARKDLGLLGLVGSNEIDSNGGRGGGTTSNFAGLAYSSPGFEYVWHGSPAEAHGMRNAGFTNAAVVDGCAMALTREAWRRIGFREDFPPHHFYDRLISTQVIEAGLKVGVLGIACDHLGGQTVSREGRYHDVAREWSEKNVTPDRYVGDPGNWSWDLTVYRAGEFMWLREYRDKKHMVPMRV